MYPRLVSTAPESGWVTLARILRPQGRKGEVLADLLTDFPEQLTAGRALALGTAAHAEPVQVVGSWLPHGKNRGRIVLELAGISTISAAEILAGKEILVKAAARVPLSDDSVYINDLCGCRLLNGSVDLGIVTDVSFPLSPDGRRRLAEAAPLLVVEATDGHEILVPFARSYLVEIDTAARILRMKLPEGLVDLNAPNATIEDTAPDPPDL